MNARNLIFGAGIGAVASCIVVKLYDKTHEKKIQEILGEKFKPLMNKLGFRSPSETVTKEIEDGLNQALNDYGPLKEKLNSKESGIINKEPYIDYADVKDSRNEYTANGNRIDSSNSSGRIEGCCGKCSGASGEDADSEHVAEKYDDCFEKTYESMEQARTDNSTSDEIQLVASPELAYNLLEMVDGEDGISEGVELEELRCQQIEKINAVDFTKAIAAGSAMQSFVFDPIEKKLYWNFTYVEIDENDIWHLIGKTNWENILDESGFNANGWIQPMYLYDTHDDVYIKVETGSASLK